MNGILLLPLFMFLFVPLHFINPTAAAAAANASSSNLVLHNLQHDALLQTGWWCPNITTSMYHCEWPRITCNYDGFVTHIQLSSYSVCNSLSGLKNIAKLNLSSFIPSLIQLDLSDNGFHGGIPSEIGMLSNLQYLFLGHNNLTGELPSEIGNLTQLLHLDVSYNKLSGLIPPSLLNLTYLRSLILRSNHFTAQIIPSWIGLLSNLQQLSLGNNGFQGAIPSAVGLLSNLSLLDLSNNFLVSPIPSSIVNLTQLEYLYLTPNHLDGTIPSEIGNLKPLRDLYMSHNNFTGSIPPSIRKLANLETFHLDDNKISGLIPAEIGYLLEVYSIDMSHNLISGEIPSEIGNLTQLDYLDLSHNNLSGQIPISLACFAHHSWRQVNFDNNHFTDQFPKCSISSNQSSKCYDQQNCFASNKIFYIKLCLPIAIFIALSILGFLFLYLRNHNAKNSIGDEVTMLKNGNFFSVWNYDGNLAFKTLLKLLKILTSDIASALVVMVVFTKLNFPPAKLLP